MISDLGVTLIINWGVGNGESGVGNRELGVVNISMPNAPFAMPYLIFCFFSALGSRVATAASSASISVRPVAAR
ncbi:hypothetical protein FM036_17935 [Nostoc sp. HG1]|nr:hypothetical protein [Nostoc sp. HG1]